MTYKFPAVKAHGLLQANDHWGSRASTQQGLSAGDPAAAKAWLHIKERPPPPGGGSYRGSEEGPKAYLTRTKPQTRRAPLIRLWIRRLKPKAAPAPSRGRGPGTRVVCWKLFFMASIAPFPL